MNSVCAFSWLSGGGGGGARGVAWRRSFERVRACRCRNGGETLLTSEREFPRLRDIYVQSMTIRDLLLAKPGFFVVVVVDHTTGMSVVLTDWDTFFFP